ncbi:MAG: hypothetical protein KF822_05260 [Steroidobacteraceae bacterium]|nr:hypothetical protein [Steroidobacteraceae bacterium]
MRTTLFVLMVLVGLLFAGFLYRQGYVEGGFGPAALLGATVLAVVVLILGLMTWLSGTRFRPIVVNALLVLTATTFTYIVVDFAAGRLLIVPLSPPLVPDPYRHHALVPDSYAELRQRDFHYIQRVNHFGLRGRETTVGKPPGTRRILMLGDSFTMGKGVEDDQTFSVLVEQELRARLATCSGGTVEVLNAGVDSYSPLLSYIQFSRDLVRFAPDLVILNLDHSDLVQEQAYRRQAVRDSSGEIVAVPQVWQQSLYERVLSWVSRNLYLTRILLVHVNRAMDHRELTVRRVVNEFGREHFAHTLEGDVDRSAQWQDIFDSIVRIKTLSASIDADFLLATYPWGHQLANAGWEAGRKDLMKDGERTSNVTQQTIRTHSTALGIDLLETLPDFKAYNSRGPLYFDYDPHWTPAGHRVMADSLAKFVRDHYISRWCTSISAKEP